VNKGVSHNAKKKFKRVQPKDQDHQKGNATIFNKIYKEKYSHRQRNQSTKKGKTKNLKHKYEEVG
jgi:hypothetical protein